MQASLKLRGNNRSSKRRWAHYLDAGGRESLRSLKRPCCPRSLKSLSSGGRSWRWATAAVEVDLEDELQVGSGGVHGQRVTGDPGGGCLRWCGAPSSASPPPRTRRRQPPRTRRRQPPRTRHCPPAAELPEKAREAPTDSMRSLPVVHGPSPYFLSTG